MVGLFVLGVVISILTYQGLTPNDEQVSDIKKQAQSYIEENFSSEYKITDSFYDNVDVYDTFTYAAVVESDQDDRFRF
ncbi:hypothetical protein [Piscibacillus salipiscarius]|nr:hypothetical protein [Piscibacillus salipiscarius]